MRSRCLFAPIQRYSNVSSEDLRHTVLPFSIPASQLTPGGASLPALHIKGNRFEVLAFLPIIRGFISFTVRLLIMSSTIWLINNLQSLLYELHFHCFTAFKAAACWHWFCTTCKRGRYKTLLHDRRFGAICNAIGYRILIISLVSKVN